MNQLRALLRNRHIRILLIVIVMLATLGLFGSYLKDNPDVLDNVLGLDATTIALLSLAYLGTVAANAFVLWASLRLIGKHVGFFENVALTGYSSVVNFFGPLQSGPGFRAVYLKSRHAVSLKRFFYVTLVFYGFFAAINGLVIVLALLGRVEQSLLPLLTLGIALIATVALLSLRGSKRIMTLFAEVRLTDRNFWFIGLGAVALAATTALAYFVELRHVDASISLLHTVIYTAAANLALFVSLTPGAIGFRESFLLLSQQLHGIPTSTVIAASVIDRAFYVVFLLVMFVALLLLGVRSRITGSGKSS